MLSCLQGVAPAAARMLLCLILVLLPGVALAGLDDAGAQAERLILRKLAEDKAYFLWRLGQHEAGEQPEDLDADAFAGEVRRARVLVPMIDQMVESAKDRPEGERIDLTQVSARSNPTYHQLAVYLNLIGALRGSDFSRARVLADQIDLGVGFGPTQSIEGYRVSLTRHYYYLRSIVHYHLHEDADAVQWLGQISADTEVRALNLDKRKEVDNVRLAGLASRPIAVTAFANLDEADEANGWVGLAVADAVVDDLVNHSDLKVVERNRIGDLLEEMSLGLMGVVNEKHAVEVGQMIEAATLIYGSYRVDGEVISLSGRLVHVESGAVLQSASVQGSADELFETVRELSTRLLADAGLLTAVERRRIAGARQPKRSAVRAVAKARLAAASNPDAARELFEEAMRTDPAYANAHEALRVQFADVTASVAVMPLRNVTGRPEDDWLGEGIAELLGRDLPVLGFSTVERLELRRVMAYQLALMDASDTADAEVLVGEAANLAALGEQVAANFLMVGGFQRLGDDLKINVRFVDVGSGQVLHTASASGPLVAYGEVVAELTKQLAREIRRELDADTLASLVDGKPSLEEFERFMRAALAKDAMVADEARAEGEADRLREEQAERERLRQAIQARVDAAAVKTTRRRYVASGVAVAGLGLATTGLLAGALDRQQAGEYRALANHSLRVDDQNANLALAEDHHGRANRWQVMGAAGVGVALAATSYMVFGGRVKPDLTGLDLGEARLSVSAAPTLDGGAARLAVTW